MKRNLSLLLLLLLLISFVVRDQQAQSTNLAGDSGATDKSDKAQLYQAVLDLTNPWTVMCVAAHPDDEDGSTLTVLRRKYGAHTVSLFSTYGEGGQNAVGPELYEELGVIRARETMAAAQVQGSEPHFLGLKDFGFSKSADEAFRAWGEKEALRRMVFQIRQLRPDVIITNHDTTSGHGHHQATGRLILQAFDAAADPKQFPEQLNQVSIWQAQRLFVRASRQADQADAKSTSAAPLQVVTIDPNEVDPVRGISYAQQALNGLRQHASQGPWPRTISPNGARIIRYNLVRQAQTADPLPANARTVLDGLRLSETISPRFTAPTIDNKPLTEFVSNRGEVLVSLINARKRGAFTAPKEIEQLDPQRFRLMSARLDQALATATGTQLVIKANDQVLVPGTKARFEVALSNSGDAEIIIRKLRSRGLPLEKQLDSAERLLPGTETSQPVIAVTPKSAAFSVPAAEHLYDGRLFGEPLTVDAELEVEGARFSLSAEKYTDVAPAVEIVSNNPIPCVETPATVGSCLIASVSLINHLHTKFDGDLMVATQVAGHAAGTTSAVSLAPDENKKMVVGTASVVPSRELLRRRLQIAPTVLSLRTPQKELVTTKTIPVVYVSGVALAGLRVGYLPSTDQTLKHSLTALGIQGQELSVQDIKDNPLSNFDTIIIDNRGYEAHHELIAANDRLLKFVEDGGTLIVFYHKTNEWNPDERVKRPQLAPYPIVLSDDRVTDEDAPIRLLQPRHPLLNFPNRITQRDFQGWIQERGLYFPKEWDQHFTALLETHDEGEAPLRGGLLVGRYGKGNYIYTSMVWYRQLRAGVAGGYRFFANMISYGHQNMGSRLPNGGGQ